MRLPALLLASVLALSTPTATLGAVSYALAAMNSTVRLSTIHNMIQGGMCSAFSIHGKLAYFLTANHCLGIEVKITGDEQPLKVVYRNQDFDIAVVKAGPEHRTRALVPTLRQLKPEQDEVSYIGYGHGWYHSLSIRGLMKGFAVFTNTGRAVALYTWFEPQCYGGQSGGPIIDKEGLVVGIVQLRNDLLNQCLGLPMSTILHFTEQYWEHKAVGAESGQ